MMDTTIIRNIFAERSQLFSGLLSGSVLWFLVMQLEVRVYGAHNLRFANPFGS